MSRVSGLRPEASSIVEFAEGLGFTAEITRGGHIRLTKPGRKMVFVSRSPSCPRAAKNAMSDIRKSDEGRL